MKAPCTTNPDIFETAFFSQMRVDGAFKPLWTAVSKISDSSGHDLNFRSHGASCCTCARHVVICEILREDIFGLHTRSEVSFK